MTRINLVQIIFMGCSLCSQPITPKVNCTWITVKTQSKFLVIVTHFFNIFSLSTMNKVTVIKKVKHDTWHPLTKMKINP